MEQAGLSSIGFQVKCGAYVDAGASKALEEERNALNAQVQDLLAQLKDAKDEISMMITVQSGFPGGASDTGHDHSEIKTIAKTELRSKDRRGMASRRPSMHAYTGLLCSLHMSTHLAPIYLGNGDSQRKMSLFRDREGYDAASSSLPTHPLHSILVGELQAAITSLLLS